MSRRRRAGLRAGGARAARGQTEASNRGDETAAVEPTEGKQRPAGHGRLGADVYRAVTRVECRHEELAAGERCPACGRGRLYRLPPGIEMRMDGRALLAAVRYELEKFRCAACGQIFTAPLPAGAGAEKYSARARAVLALARYYLGVPWYRLESFQALVGVPVPDATQWDQVEHVGNCAYPLFKHLERLAAQGDLTVPGAPLDNNMAERALKLCIRQRKNSLFYATEHSAYVASLPTSVIATCLQAGVNALEYLVAIQEHRQAVFANPGAWLPWTYATAPTPS